MKIEIEPGAEFGRWSVDGSPRGIEFEPRFWADIVHAVLGEFLRVPWGGPEVGGVLFGRREAGCVRILAFQPFESEHLYGPAFELSEDDESRLRDLLERAKADEELAGLEAVGWYRSGYRWLALTERDVKLYNRFFPEPWQIVIAFLRERERPSLLGLFYRREDGSLASLQNEFIAREVLPKTQPPLPAPQPEPEPLPPPKPEPVPLPPPKPEPEPEPRPALVPQTKVLPAVKEIVAPRTFLDFWGFPQGAFASAAAHSWDLRHDAALSKLMHAIRSRNGLYLLTGESGTGKTALLERLGDSLTREKIAFAFLLDSKLSAEEFYEFLAYDLALPGGRSRPAVLNDLQELLMEQTRKGSTTALIIDDAHLLVREVLEEIRTLDNLQHRTGRMLQTILCGSPELERRLESDELWQIRERIAGRYRLPPPREEETTQWIERQLKVRGVADRTVFTPDVLAAVHARSRGVPAVAGAICDGLLEICFARATRVATMEMLAEVCAHSGAK